MFQLKRVIRESVARELARNNRPCGFTVVEMLVGMVILAVGVAGFTGMMLTQYRLGRINRKTDETATLVQTTIEDYAGQCWDDLGTDTATPTEIGLANGDIYTTGPLNRNGEASGTGTGPYSFYLHIVICSSTDTNAIGGSPDACAKGSMSDITRPEGLECNGLGLSTREKMVRVLVAWTDSYGTCHSKSTDSLAFDWDGPGSTC